MGLYKILQNVKYTVTCFKFFQAGISATFLRVPLIYAHYINYQHTISEFCYMLVYLEYEHLHSGNFPVPTG